MQEFNLQLCHERHGEINRRIANLESKYNAMILLLVANLTGMIGVLVTLWLQP